MDVTATIAIMRLISEILSKSEINIRGFRFKKRVRFKQVHKIKRFNELQQYRRSAVIFIELSKLSCSELFVIVIMRSTKA